MITTEEIAIRVRQVLLDSGIANEISGNVAYQRNDYSKEDIIIIPHAMTGEDSVRNGQINVNIHVPDIAQAQAGGKVTYHTDFARLVAIRAKAIEALQNHYEYGCGYNWNVGLINPPMQEVGHNEHFVSFALELFIREKKNI